MARRTVSKSCLMAELCFYRFVFCAFCLCSDTYIHMYIYIHIHVHVYIYIHIYICCIYGMMECIY